MKKLFITSSLACRFFIFNTASAIPVHIIPQPLQVTERKGVFHFNPASQIFLSVENKEISKECLQVVNHFTAGFLAAANIHLPVSLQPFKNDVDGAIMISIKSDTSIKSKEGYILDILERKIVIIAADGAGLFYAFESLKQLLPPQFYEPKGVKNFQDWSIPCAYILDYPKYGYRGMLLDESRHFFGEKFIKEYLDILARFKINIFHWHLTDSHGWRIEIKQYPRLTSIGAWRADRKNIPMTIAEPTGIDEPATYGGYYTQEQIKAIVQYAKERFITIIPEIEMPGHCDAALVAYPQYNCLNNPVPLQIPCGYPQDLTHNFCVGYDSTFIFLQNILSEIIQLFPGPYIHIGGDEVRTKPWEHCSRCIKRMKDENLSSFRQLQNYFTHRIDSFIAARGKRTIGWDEILHADISPQATAVAWHGTEETNEDLKKNHDVVMAPYHFTYFDFYQSDPGLEPEITYASLFLDTVYAFNPIPDGISPEKQKYIKGGEACLWTENVATPQRVWYMLLPRLLALSESLWSYPDKKDYSIFIDKVESEFKRFDREKINYSKSMYNVSIRPVFDSSKKQVSVSLTDQTHHYQIRYSLDGSVPTFKSALYTSNLSITKSTVLKAAVFKGEKMLGKLNIDSFKIHIAVGSTVKIEPGDTSAIAMYAALADGIFGTVEPYDGRWLALHDSLVSITIKLNSTQAVHRVAMHFMEDQVSDIYLPKNIKIFISDDGKNFRNIGEISNDKLPLQKLRDIVSYRSKEINSKTNYIKIVLQNENSFPLEPARNLILVDEIVVE